MSCTGAHGYLQFIKCCVEFHGRHMHIRPSPHHWFRGLSELYHVTECVNCQYGHICDTLPSGREGKNNAFDIQLRQSKISNLGQLYEVLIMSDVVTRSEGHHSTSHMQTQGAPASSYAAQRNTNARYHTLCPSTEAMTTLVQGLGTEQ